MQAKKFDFMRFFENIKNSVLQVRIQDIEDDNRKVYVFDKIEPFEHNGLIEITAANPFLVMHFYNLCVSKVGEDTVYADSPDGKRYYMVFKQK